MKILAFETSSAACSAAIYVETDDGRKQTFSAHEICPMQHTSVILPMIQSLLTTAGTAIDELDAIAFGCGPGSFTGIRIAASLAQGIAFAKSLPVIPISSLAILAETEYLQHGYEHVIAAVDARMSQIYMAAYKIENGIPVPVLADQIISPDSVPTVEAANWHAVGDGFLVYRDQIVYGLGFMPATIHENGLPMASAMIPMAVERFKHKQWVSAADALPVYLR